MARSVVLMSLNKMEDGVEDSLGCVTQGPVELYLDVDEYRTLEKTIHSLFDEDSVRRIQEAMKSVKS